MIISIYILCDRTKQNIWHKVKSICPKHCCDSNGAVMHSSAYTGGYNYSDSMFAPIQWETSLQSNAVSHWLLAANIESALIIESHLLFNLLSYLQSRNDHSFKCYSFWNQHQQRRYRYDKPKPFVVNTNIKMRMSNLNWKKIFFDQGDYIIDSVSFCRCVSKIFSIKMQSTIVRRVPQYEICNYFISCVFD